MINYKDESAELFREPDDIIILRLIEHINKKQEGSMSDYILDFCEENNYHIEDVADLIKNNKNIRSLLKQDCIYHGILKNEKDIPYQKIEEW